MSPEKNKDHPTLADRVLAGVRDTRQAVSVYLVNGFQLKGEIVEFDEEAIIFKLKDVHQLVMRTAVAALYPLISSKQEADAWWRDYLPAEAESP